ncbi:helicase-related protein [Microvirga roseola]|uniref:helicase-related protein n=1 Tax=Microvirga roseola TaxID=2883126 RepID=UPI001E44B781|nr:helicase-related protein [Microvirga roseola]
MARRSLPPQARARGVTAVLGPTNTGKTHLAIERMLGHESGMIGLPLRLLAREVYNRVVEKAGHHNVALITGEEKIKPDRPRYWISTVEAMPRDLDPAFVAVDEIQLASDLDRGHVFTDRVLNQRGREETLLIGSSTMRPLIEALIPGVHVITRPRLSKLSFAGEKKVSRLPRRSAIVAFSAEEVYGIAELIRRQSGGAAVVLGALSPRTRNAQVELYQNGDVDYLIATDAIGMGLNLDVDHVAFASDKKFDGFQFRKLNNPELAQIAGRAGRYMRDGTFGTTGRCPPFDADTVEALENHVFDPVRILQWRNPDLNFSSLAALRDSLGVQPREHGLVRAPTGEDVAALEVLARDDEISAYARTPYAVDRLWQICQVPDYRKVSPQTHADLVGQIYRFLMKDGAIPADWFARHLSAMDRTDGDIDTLSNRIAQVRTWSFIANRPDWLKDPEHWQGVARQVEDKLSDALHERLAQRFIDRRTSVLMRRLRENTMLEAEITTSGDVTVEGQHIGHLHGFHFVPDPQADTSEAKTLRNAASKALAGEIEARADRFAETPDTMLVLSNDGTARWMGDPVAKLEPGDKLFEPRLRILSDEHLTGPARDKVDNRLRAWLKAYVVRLLGPLIQLEESTELTGLARGIAFQVGEALGVLERSKVLNEVRSLDQDARAALRKAGIRFGAYHLYVPALLKPAPRILAAQLWALQNGGLDQKGIDEIAHLAQSGRTSIPVDPEIAAGLYRAAGFRVCGGRAVRVDILERLADLIRPAIAYRPGITPGEPPAGAADGEAFVATVAMTSLVGCAGEDFATILKSLGYVVERRPGPAITVPLASPAPQESASQAAAEGGENTAAAEAPSEAAAAAPAPAEEAAPAVAESTVPETAPTEAPALEEGQGDVVSASGAVELPADAAAEAAAEAPAEPETVEVWRQGRRHHEGGQARHGRDARPRQDRGDRRPRHGEARGERPSGERPPRPERCEAQGEGGRPQNRPPRGPGRGEDRRGPRPDKRADNRREERREKQPDPNSPFAKLMALKAQLEDSKK